MNKELINCWMCLESVVQEFILLHGGSTEIVNQKSAIWTIHKKRTYSKDILGEEFFFLDTLI